MNQVTPCTPLPQVLELMDRDGYVLMHDALTPAQLAELTPAYDEQLALHPPTAGALRVEVPRILERDTRFEQLMDNEPTFRVVRAILGPDVELAASGELDCKLPHTPAYIGWHNDFQWMSTVPYPRQNYWLRCTFFMSEVTSEGGPFTLLPGSHLSPRMCPAGLVDESGQPQPLDGQLGISGPAGSCLINNTEIWHCNSANRSAAPRRLIMLTYKHAWMKQWQEGYATTPEFAARQTGPVRRQLCGCYPWHYPAAHFPVHALEP